MKLTIALVCLLFAATLCDITYKKGSCNPPSTAPVLANKDKEKIKIEMDKDNDCGYMITTITIEKGDKDFYVKIGRYDKDKVGAIIGFTLTVIGTTPFATSKNEKHQIVGGSLRSMKGHTIKGLDGTGTLIIGHGNSAGRGKNVKGVKQTITVGRGSFTDIGPIIFWVVFVLLVIGSILLLIVTIVLAILVVKKLKK